MRMILALWFSCAPAQPEWCEGRQGDPDCDGVVEASDLCPDTEIGVLTDRVGCSERQTAGCAVVLASPADKTRAPEVFRWTGDCDAYLLQFSNDPTFPPGATRTAVNTPDQAVSATGTERWWRVVGGVRGGSTGFATDPREVNW